MANTGKGSNAARKGTGEVGFQPRDKSTLPGKTNIPTASLLTPPPASVPEPYPTGASREVMDAWYARQKEQREADRLAHNEWRTANYPEDVRGARFDYPFTQESDTIRVSTSGDGQAIYIYPATAFSEGSARTAELKAERQRATDELVESGLAEVDERGVWMVQACESRENGYNHKTMVLKEEYDSLPPMHKFIIAHATDSFGSTLMGRTFRVSGSD